MSNFTNGQVKIASDFLQYYMRKNIISLMTADEAASLLAEHNILPNNDGPKPGFNFRQMLRDGRDGFIDFVSGAEQDRPNTRWRIKVVDRV